MPCTQSSTLHEIVPKAEVTTTLLDLETEITCSLTKKLCFDSVESSAMSSNTSSLSDMSSLRGAEYYGALSSIDTSTNYNSGGGRFIETEVSSSQPTNSWCQASGATMITPTYGTSNYPLTNSISYPNHNLHHVSRESIKLENHEPAVWPSHTSLGTPPIGGVNASSCIPCHHLNSCYAYALDRGNGQYTQLVPADCLPVLLGLPSLQGPEGLIILSPPRGPLPSHVGYNFAPSIIGTGRPSSRSSDAVQSTIDSIVARLPPAPKKREKIYCDKWIHDGVCAFAQQGCRYKHEMPMDKATQHTVGLYNGLPKWYKEKHAVERRANPLTSSIRSQPSPLSGRNALMNGGSWRGGHSGRGGVAHMQSSSPAPRSVCDPRSSGSPVPSNSWRGGAYSAHSNGRPVSGVSSAASSNPYDLLFEQGEAEIDDDEV